MYGFLLLRVPPEGTLQKKLAALGVQLLGPHVNHQKARLPVGSLEAIAALADVEWLGVSPPEQKLSSELTELRGAQAKEAAVTPAAGLPIDCQPHGLRKAAGRRLAEAGCTAHEIMSVLGHKTLSEAER